MKSTCVIIFMLSAGILFGQGTLKLTVIPDHVYKTKEGYTEDAGYEKCWFRISIHSNQTVVSLDSSELHACSNGKLKLHQRTFALPMENPDYRPLSSLGDLREELGIFHQLSFPVSDSIDRITYCLWVTGADGCCHHASIGFAVEEFRQHADIIFPLTGTVYIGATGITDPGGHQERSQAYAYDIIGVGEHYNLLVGGDGTNESFAGWGQEVINPGKGVVIFSRNDIPDNQRPSRLSLEELFSYPDSIWAVGGNCVVIDHGYGEISYLGHLKQGSVTVSTGDTLEQGDVVGLLGNSGNSSGPHLHYHLMTGSTLFKCDGLPVRFRNTGYQTLLPPGLLEVEDF